MKTQKQICQRALENRAAAVPSVWQPFSSCPTCPKRRFRKWRLSGVRVELGWGQSEVGAGQSRFLCRAKVTSLRVRPTGLSSWCTATQSRCKDTTIPLRSTNPPPSKNVKINNKTGILLFNQLNINDVVEVQSGAVHLQAMPRFNDQQHINIQHGWQFVFR